MKTNKIFSLMAMLFVAVLSTGFLASCSDDDDDDALAGTWEYSYSDTSNDYYNVTDIITITFNGDNTGSYSRNYSKRYQASSSSNNEIWSYTNTFAYNWDPEKSDSYGTLRVVWTNDASDPNGYKKGQATEWEFSLGGDALFINGKGYIRK